MIKPLSHSKTHEYSQACVKIVLNMAESIPAMSENAVAVYAVVNLVNLNGASH